MKYRLFCAFTGEGGREMAYFPFFADLSGLRGLVVGGGGVALEKVRRLLPYGPGLTVVSPLLREELRALEGVTLVERPFAVPDLEGCDFVMAATDDRTVNRRVASLCRARRIPVNAADSREDSTFLFPALLRRGALSVGVCTSGASPAAAARLRDRFAQALPENIEEILQFLAELRSTLPEGAARRRLLSGVAAECMELGRPLDRGELAQRLAEAGGGEPR